MEGIVLYKSKYGSTSDYAYWLGDSLGLYVVDIDKNNSDLSVFDFIIMGAPVYMGKLLIKEWLLKNQTWLQHKNLFIFIVCATSPEQGDKQRLIIKDNIPPALEKTSSIHFLAGRLVIKKLSWKDRWIIRFSALLEKDPVKTKAILRGIDGVKKENLHGIITQVQAYLTHAW